MDIIASRKKEISKLVPVLMIFMATATLMIQVVDLQAQGTFSLRQVSWPSGTPLFRIESTSDARYLRTAVGIIYDGKVWHLEDHPVPYHDIDTGPDSGELPRLPLSAAQLARGHRDFNRGILNKVSTIDDPRYLELPPNISERVKDLARRITEGMPTPFEKAKAIETFLQAKYKYKLDFTPAPPDREAHDWFLFESKEGTCSHFNSAFVILARASGIPSRLAIGYLIRPGEGEQVVYAHQAHAWAEVGFEGLGWIVFEATPP
ncbi:transglutaminase-like domain-containing protein [Dehalococcoidia bacterium]|nr:transglutaminase-like domain-containing protein [Dehalococcoidia bacterium]